MVMFYGSVKRDVFSIQSILFLSHRSSLLTITLRSKQNQFYFVCIQVRLKFWSFNQVNSYFILAAINSSLPCFSWSSSQRNWKNALKRLVPLTERFSTSAIPHNLHTFTQASATRCCGWAVTLEMRTVHTYTVSDTKSQPWHGIQHAITEFHAVACVS